MFKYPYVLQEINIEKCLKYIFDKIILLHLKEVINEYTLRKYN